MHALRFLSPIEAQEDSKIYPSVPNSAGFGDVLSLIDAYRISESDHHALKLLPYQIFLLARVFRFLSQLSVKAHSLFCCRIFLCSPKSAS